MSLDLQVRALRPWAYQDCLQAMRSFTLERNDSTVDELWFVEHPSVFTQGLAGKADHVINPGHIEVVQTERGGQVTYHGPGQLLAYTLLDLRRRNITVRGLVCHLERAAMHYLATLGLSTTTKQSAPGVYLKESDGAPGAKIAALGLKITRGCSFHGIALNVDVDLEPFSRINPCGYPGLEVTSIKKALGYGPSLMEVSAGFASALQEELKAKS